MAVRYRVTLNQEEHSMLKEISSKGVRAARTVISARALLWLDVGEFAEEKWTLSQVSSALGRSTRSLEALKKRFVEEGAQVAIERKKRETIRERYKIRRKRVA